MCKVCFREKSDTAPHCHRMSIPPISAFSSFPLPLLYFFACSFSWVKIWWCRKYFVPLHCYQETP